MKTLVLPPIIEGKIARQDDKLEGLAEMPKF